MATERGSATPEDLLSIRDRPIPDLVNGRMVERAPLGCHADVIAGQILYAISNFVRRRKLGVMNGSRCGFQIFPDDPFKVRVPHGAFTRWEKFGGRGLPRGHATTVPDLVFEVLAPDAKARPLWARIEDFLSAGVLMVLVADPDTRTLEVIRGDRTAIRLRPEDEFNGESVLPGFRCKVADLFEMD